jgi:hypothetical protein
MANEKNLKPYKKGQSSRLPPQYSLPKEATKNINSKGKIWRMKKI